MAAVIQKNESVNTARRALMRVFLADGMTPYWRGGSFVGRQYVGKSQASLTAALGSITNIRRPRTFTAFTFTANSVTDLLTKTQHGQETGDGSSTTSNSGGSLPGGLAAATPYWVIKIDDDNFKLATSLANAYLGVAIDITSNGTGTQTFTAGASCERGLDGEFLMEFGQTETNVNGSELLAVAEDEKKVVTANTTTEEITLTAHELVTGVPVLFSTSNALPAPLAVSTYYWVVRTGANTFKLATSFANAIAGTTIDLTTTGTGVQYLEPVIQRAVTTANLERSGASAWDGIGEDSYTYGDLFRMIVSVLCGQVLDFETGTQVFKSLSGAKTRLTGTTTPNGRTASTPGDLTP